MVFGGGPDRGYGPRRRGLGGARLLVGVLVAGFAILSYCNQRSKNPITGETQYVAITPEQEIALGLESTPEMMRQFGGPSDEPEAAAAVARVGQQIVASSDAAKSGYEYHFTLLDDEKTVNAFALPGGPVFITEALFARLKTEGQLAGVLGHEVGHVIARHSAQRIAQQQLTQGLTGALILSTYDPNDPGSANTARMAMVIGSLVNMKYGREDELESDRLGVRLMAQSGYDPRSLIDVMQILEDASGGQAPPEFMSTHPSPGNRAGEIERAIAHEFPNGLPQGLVP
ncbi:MAG: M48 family metalloprotease [Candidatus Eiseniibacteriota bacterium]